MASLPNNNLEQTLRDRAAGPAAATGESQSVTERPLTELIAADKYLEAKAARKAAKGDGWSLVGKRRIRNGGHT